MSAIGMVALVAQTRRLRSVASEMVWAGVVRRAMALRIKASQSRRAVGGVTALIIATA
jgi:hypothetical protein